MLRVKFFRSFGFTVTEMVMTLLVGSVLVTMAVPSFQNIIQNNRAVAFSSDFIAALQLARSEAIRRGDFVSVCPTGNANFTACGGNSDWKDGWIVFVDPDGNGVIANASDLLQVNQPENSENEIITQQDLVTMASNGFVAAGAGQFNLEANGCQGDHAKGINLSNTGRINITDVACGSTTDTINANPNTGSNNEDKDTSWWSWWWDKFTGKDNNGGSGGGSGGGS